MSYCYADLAAGYHMSDLLIERAIEMDRKLTVIPCASLSSENVALCRKARYLCSIHELHQPAGQQSR
jgi:hypothetical protein